MKERRAARAGSCKESSPPLWPCRGKRSTQSRRIATPRRAACARAFSKRLSKRCSLDARERSGLRSQAIEAARVSIEPALLRSDLRFEAVLPALVPVASAGRPGTGIAGRIR